MHYYQHHIGDFIKATARLSDSQTMAYLRLLWMYYDTEKPLILDTELLAFQIGTSIQDTELLLRTFFILTDEGWKQTRCEEEILEYREYRSKKSLAGKASAERRKNTRSTPVQHMLNDSSTDVQLTTNHKPITIVETKQSRGTRLPADWILNEEQIEFCKKTRPDLNPTATADRFRDYWIAQPGAKGVKLNWDSTWRNWVRIERSKDSISNQPQALKGWK
jgi:uncharacterized protein YdaU (DUF1376 family)